MDKDKSSGLMKWVKRILLGLLALVLLLVGLFAGAVLFDALFGSDTADFANVEYENSAGEKLYGYLAQPEEPGPHPGILLIHEWWGLNEGITILADALAAEGYVVFAADGYGGQVTASLPRALWLRITTPAEQVEADIDSGLAYLRGLDGVDTGSGGVDGLLLRRGAFFAVGSAPVGEPGADDHLLWRGGHGAGSAAAAD